MLSFIFPTPGRVLVSGTEHFGADAVVRILVPEGWGDRDEAANGGGSGDGSDGASRPTIDCLHSVLRRFEDEDRATADQHHRGSGSLQPFSLLRRFVRFTTGKQAITQGMAITVKRSCGGLGRYPEASTCVSELRLPDYRSEVELYTKLRTAICARGDMADDHGG